MGNDELEIVDRYKYLGTFFTSNGSFLNARKHVVEQAKKAMHLLYTKSRNFGLPVDLTLKLFDHTIVPILTYGSEIWGYENLEIIEKVHNDFLRKITSARKSTPIYMLHGELGRYPISIIIYSRMVGFWNRILIGKDVKYSRLLYDVLITHRTRIFKWPSKIKSILDHVGKSDLWTFQSNINTANLKILIKSVLIDQYKQNWCSLLTQSNKARIYGSFKESLELEKYFSILPMTNCINMFKFRTANNKLPIETGRWDGTEYSLRTCNLCRSNAIGDEKHYLFSCVFFIDERQNLLRNETRYSLNKLLTRNDEKTLLNLSKFVCTIMKTVR